jgi:hypothetical protein
MQIKPPQSEEDLKALMRDDRYWQSGHPEFADLRNIVAAGFESLEGRPKTHHKPGTGGLVEGMRRYRQQLAQEQAEETEREDTIPDHWSVDPETGVRIDLEDGLPVYVPGDHEPTEKPLRERPPAEPYFPGYPGIRG